MAEYERRCANPQCGRQFVAKRADTMFCPGSRCRVAMHRAKKVLRRLKPLQTDGNGLESKLVPVEVSEVERMREALEAVSTGRRYVSELLTDLEVWEYCAAEMRLACKTLDIGISVTGAVCDEGELLEGTINVWFYRDEERLKSYRSVLNDEEMPMEAWVRTLGALEGETEEEIEASVRRLYKAEEMVRDGEDVECLCEVGVE